MTIRHLRYTESVYNRAMRNVTISLEADMLSRVKQHASKRGLSVNALIKLLLTKELAVDDPDWLEAFFAKADQLGLRSADGQPLARAEIYDR